MTSRELSKYDAMIIDTFFDDKDKYILATKLATNVYQLTLLVRDLRQITDNCLNCRNMNSITREIYKTLDEQIYKALDESDRQMRQLNEMLWGEE